MRKFIPAVVLMLAAGSAVAQEPQRPPANEPSQAGAIPVAGTAVARLSTIKAGDKVTLTLTMDPVTNKESVTSIEKPKTSSD